MISSNDTVLFIGDSITDAGRNYELADEANNPAGLGRSYVFHIAARLLETCDPDNRLQIFNRGISGNRITNLAERWDTDVIALKPTLVSIFIGINDTWHGVAKGTPENGVPLDRFDRIYRELIEKTQRELPDTRLILCEPFVTETGAVLELDFHPDVDERQKLVQQIAKDFNLTRVPFQSVINDALDHLSPEQLAADGVHPTIAGHLVLARAWLNTVLK